MYGINPCKMSSCTSIQQHAWILVPYSSNLPVLNNKWIFRIKHNLDGSINKYKARLVAKGFQQTVVLDFFETFSRVIKPCTIRLILCLAATYNWDIQQVDINNAFLNGELNEVVYMHQPTGFLSSTHPDYGYRLNKALYGLRQEPGHVLISSNNQYYDGTSLILSQITVYFSRS